MILNIQYNLQFLNNVSGILDERMRYMLKSVAAYFIHHPEAKGITISLLFNSQILNAIHERIREQWQEHNQESRDFIAAPMPQAVISSGTRAIFLPVRRTYHHERIRKTT